MERASMPAPSVPATVSQPTVPVSATLSHADWPASDRRVIVRGTSQEPEDMFRARVTGHSSNGLVRVIGIDGSRAGGKNEGVWFGFDGPIVGRDVARSAIGDSVLVHVKGDKIIRWSPVMPDSVSVSRRATVPSASVKTVTPTQSLRDHIVREGEKPRGKRRGKGSRHAADREASRRLDVAASDTGLDASARLADVARGNTTSTYVPDTTSRRCSGCMRTMVRASDLFDGKCAVCRSR